MRADSAHLDTGPPIRAAASVPFAILSRPVLAEPRIGPSAKLLLLGLQQFGWRSARCSPTLGDLTDATNLSESTVRRGLAELAACGFIRVEPDPDSEAGRALVLVWLDDPRLHPHRIADPEGPRDAAARGPAPGPGSQNATPGASNRPAPPRQIETPLINRSRSTGESNQPPLTPPAPPPAAAPAAETMDRAPSRNENERSNDPHGDGLREMRERFEPWLRAGGAMAEAARRTLEAAARKERSGPQPAAVAIASARAAGRLGIAAAAAPVPDGAVDTRSLLARLGPGSGREEVQRCVWRLCREFNDGHSQGFYTATLRDVRAGALPTAAVVHAYERATGPGIRRPGAAFAAAVRSGLVPAGEAC